MTSANKQVEIWRAKARKQMDIAWGMRSDLPPDKFFEQYAIPFIELIQDMPSRVPEADKVEFGAIADTLLHDLETWAATLYSRDLEKMSQGGVAAKWLAERTSREMWDSVMDMYAAESGRSAGMTVEGGAAVSGNRFRRPGGAGE